VDAADVETVALLAARHGGGMPAAVLPLQRLGNAFFLCAFAHAEGGADDPYRWLLVDGGGAPVTEPAAVRGAAEVVAMCETAEEAAAALAADEALPLLRRALVVADEHADAEASLAARATIEALEDMVAVLPEFRVADAVYVDRLAERANLVGDRFDLLKEAAGDVTARLGGVPGEPLEPLAQLLWDAVRLLARDGAPDRFANTMEGAIGAAAAFAEDVERHYLLELDDDEDRPDVEEASA
jgi:hypothetical protein